MVDYNSDSMVHAKSISKILFLFCSKKCQLLKSLSCDSRNCLYQAVRSVLVILVDHYCYLFCSVVAYSAKAVASTSQNILIFQKLSIFMTPLFLMLSILSRSHFLSSLAIRVCLSHLKRVHWYRALYSMPIARLQRLKGQIVKD